MSNPDNTSKSLQLDAFTNGDDIGPWFAVRNSVIRLSLHNVDNTVEADFVPYRYEIGSKLRKALNEIDRRDSGKMSAKSKL
ncbi:unnamed protein product [Nippostrongylus brasiliensis]|uniref:Uncharacterized protein n=1 Tax=Nippostrongylus brasiliensis TaxID=27835 RepID=A0A0N4YJ61_NIPBR|nr:unnamed protein product [Nippostrongylus brasiliensis]